MEFSIKCPTPEKQKSGCIVLGVFEPRQLSAPAALVDQASGSHLSAILRHGDMEGQAESTLLLHNVPGIAAERVLLVGLGKPSEYGEKAYVGAVNAAFSALSRTGTKDAAFYLNGLGGLDAEWELFHAVIAGRESRYRSDGLKSGKEKKSPSLRKIAFCSEGAENALKQAVAVAEAMDFAKDLGNLPGNFCTPTYLADQAEALAKSLKLDSRILGEKEISELGMGAFLAVAKGSDEPHKLIVLEYRGGSKKDKPVVLVGKGITFDTGGISLKPGAEMDEMKYDMCGAASVLAAIRAAAEMKLKLNVVAIVPTCENMPGPRSAKPGDIVTSLSGQTIEILNTDAEGRLILCDALTYAERYDPDVVVDVATLTGACIIALGNVASGLYSNDDALAGALLEAGNYARDRAWHMPLWDDYQEQLKSNFADMANIGGRPAGSITAACFLSKFTHKYRWAHLDVAGTAHRSGTHKGATGRPVPLLCRFLIERSRRA